MESIVAGETENRTIYFGETPYAVRRFGADHVAIGTDVANSSPAAAAERRKVPRRGPRRDRWDALWPDDPFVATPEATESLSWTNWPLFTVGMVQRGHSDEVIRKILGGNALRVARDAMTRATGRESNRDAT